MKLFVNNQEIDVPPHAEAKRIVEFLREDLDLTGVKNACDIGACGACTILVDNEPHRICLKRVKDFAGRRILTIEGLAAPDGALHPLQRAFVDCGAFQCGFCTPGMVLTAHAFLLKNPRPTRDQIRRAIFQNLCRCTGYQQIIDAVERAAPHYQRDKRRLSTTSSSGKPVGTRVAPSGGRGQKRRTVPPHPDPLPRGERESQPGGPHA